MLELEVAPVPYFIEIEPSPPKLGGGVGNHTLSQDQQADLLDLLEYYEKIFNRCVSYIRLLLGLEFSIPGYLQLVEVDALKISTWYS